MRNRLKAILNIIPACHVAADIGCDHGKLAASIIKVGRCDKVIATDISCPSLEKAKALAKKLKIEHHLEFRQGDGLKVLNAGEADVIIMAGWGGRNMHASICGNMEVAQHALLVLQPMSETKELRKLLSQGFAIVEEQLVQEDRRYYDIICARYDENAAELSDMLCEIGPRLLDKRHPLLKPKLEKALNGMQQELEGLWDINTPKAKNRRMHLENKIQEYMEVLKCL